MSKSIIVPQGKYFLGDPCYCFNASTWTAILAATDCLEEPLEYPNGELLLAFSTKYGDGLYYDQHDNNYYVDSGCIGLVPAGRIEKQPEEYLGQFVEFPNFTVCTEEDGELSFGPYIIDTKCEEELEGEEPDFDWVETSDEY